MVHCKLGRCSICKIEFSRIGAIYKLNCDHTYHQNCITRWISGSQTCPLCYSHATLNDIKKYPNFGTLEETNVSDDEGGSDGGLMNQSTNTPQNPNQNMQIIVSDLDSKKVALPPLKPTSTVLQMKNKLREICGIREEEQRLMFRGKNLQEDQRTLSFYNITANCVVHLLMRLNGGDEIYNN